MTKIIIFIKTFKNKDGDKDKNKHNKLISFRINDDKLLEKNKKPFGLKLKTYKIFNWMFHYFTKWFSDKANTNFYSLTVLEKATESESFAIISIDPLVAHKTYITFNYI